jgi:RsiW-degrading membrane proteinase PrsW (M82 family)
VSRVKTVVATEMLLVVGLLAFVGVAFGAQKILGLSDPVHVGVPLAFLLSAVPAGLWLGYFYLQDRHEPEPKHYVAGVYLAGGFVAAPVASFIMDHLLPAQESALAVAITPERVLHAILVVGLAQEFAKFVIVRYSIYLSDEFDEPMDGIIYMTAAGIGFATAQNIHYFSGIGGVFLGIGAGNAVIITMAHACFAGVQGYALGRAKFSGFTPLRRNLTLTGGLVLAATLNGLFDLLEERVTNAGLTSQPWRGLAFASGFAVVVFMMTSLMMRRHLADSPHAPPTPPPTTPAAPVRP